LEPRAKRTAGKPFAGSSYFGMVGGGDGRGKGQGVFHESNRRGERRAGGGKLEARGGIEPPIMVLQTMSTIQIAFIYACFRAVIPILYPTRGTLGFRRKPCKADTFGGTGDGGY
jgi:hypothetical protein